MSTLTFIILYFFIFLHGVMGEVDTCPVRNADTPLAKLRQALTCVYDPFIGPVNNQNMTNVTIRTILKYISYNDYGGSMVIDAWMVATWKDQHLSWNPSDYDNIRYIWLHTTDMWTPQIIVSNTADSMSDNSLITPTKCLVFKQGTILCVPSIHIELLCTPDLTYYPFDKRNCSLLLQVLDHNVEHVNVTMRTISTYDLKKNGEWKLDSWKSLKLIRKLCCPDKVENWIKIKFEFSRLFTAHMAVIIVPLIVTFMLALLPLLVPYYDKERMKLCYFNIFVHFVQIQFVTFDLPLKGENSPLILAFCRDSLLMAVFTLMLTLVLRNLTKKITTPPEFICMIVQWCSCGSVKFLTSAGFNFNNISYMKSEEDQEQIVESTGSGETNPKSVDWIKFGLLINNILFLIYILTYLIMLIKFFS